MTFTAPAYTARIIGTPDIPVMIRSDSGQLTLDASRAPHVEGSVTLSVADAAMLESLDPRDNRRLVIDAGGRTFDLGIREANPGRGAATVDVQLASDEALLGDFAQLIDDKGPRAHEASLRAVVDYVLGQIDAHLESGAEDADVTAYWEITNLITNPSCETTSTGWAGGTGASALTRATLAGVPPVQGAWSLRWTAADGVSNVVPQTSNGSLYTVRPGEWYVFAAYIASGTPRQAHAAIQWWSAGGSVPSSIAAGAPVTTSTTEYKRVWVIAQCPPGVDRAVPYLSTLGNAAGNMHFADAAMFYEGDELVEYFDGSTPDDAFYEYEWQADAHVSTSTRTPVVERPPAALTWRAGDSAITFLAPLVQAAGFRLVCNERREWTLRSAEFRDPGSQTFRYGVNIITADEQLSRSSDEWFDGAVYVYVWTDDNGIEQTRIDSYALTLTPSKVVRREIRAAFPGPGRAQYAVTRAQGRGRTVTATKQADWTEAAEQAFSALLDGTPIQVGTANSVQFDLASNQVTTTSRTTDTPAAAWVLIPAGEAWLDSPIGESWTEEVI